MGDDHYSKVVPLRSRKPRLMLDPRLEEMLRLLHESEPIGGELSDDEVIRDEDKFRRRFGPGFRWRRRHRESLINLKHEYDLTDSEIRFFQYTGNLRRTPFGVQLSVSPWIALWGGVQLVWFSSLFVALLFAAVPNLTASPMQAAKVLPVLGGLFMFCYTLYWFYIKPWQLQRQLQAERNRDAR